jgi:hypothetical protein
LDLHLMVSWRICFSCIAAWIFAFPSKQCSLLLGTTTFMTYATAIAICRSDYSHGRRRQSFNLQHSEWPAMNAICQIFEETNIYQLQGVAPMQQRPAPSSNAYSSAHLRSATHNPCSRNVRSPPPQLRVIIGISTELVYLDVPGMKLRVPELDASAINEA